MAGHTVLVLGGGVGGVVAANELRRCLPGDDRVVAIERAAEHLFQPSLLWLMVGRRRRDAIARPLRDLLARGVELVRAEVTGIDPATRSVTTTAGTFTGDALVVALGARPDPDAVPGFREAAHDVFAPDGADSMASALRTFRGGRVVVAVAGLPYKCPAAPYETALLLDDELRRRGVRDAATLDVYSPEPAPMPVAGPVMGRAVVELLQAKGITFHPGTKVERFEPGERVIELADGARAPFDLLAGIAPHRAPDVVAGSALAGAQGWIPVDRATLETAHAGVFAIGDVTTITLANGKPLPRAGVFAHGEALTVARKIASRWSGGPAPSGFAGLGYCWVEAGGGRAAFAAGDFFAQPDPTIALRRPSRLLHLGKVVFERSWVGNRLERPIARGALAIGARMLGVRAEP